MKLSLFIFTIFKKIKLLQEFGIKIEVNWNYDELDEDLFETGKELQKIFPDKIQTVVQFCDFQRISFLNSTSEKSPVLLFYK